MFVVRVRSQRPDAQEVPPRAATRVLTRSLYAAVRVTRAALPALTETRGAVVNVSSDSSLMPHTVPLSYATAKAALNAFSRGLAEKVGGSGVRVNVVTPGATRTPS